MGSNIAFAGTNQLSTLVEGVNNTCSSPIAAFESPCDDGVLRGNSGHVTFKDPPSQQHVPSLGETDLSKPNVDTSIIHTNVKEQDSASTSLRVVAANGSEDSDDEVDEVLVMESGGFLDDMEDYHDGYDDQVVLSDKLQATCEQFDIRLNTRRR
ncbi:hypothetical protein CTI12_AA422620 [Artemisia annua]|uniref:Uncharacterized protein n=1 Tax=Artemisia annua TaxID=35608 RepID=A0A2U1M4I8_ARTAN|nr:hypothetical protein CTI12_AA422620 [Artemisia annua]